MKDYLVSVPDSTKVVESTNFIAFDAPAQERKLRRADLAKCDAVKAAHDEVWALAKKLFAMDFDERVEAFGEPWFPDDLIKHFSYDEIAMRYAAWEKKKAEEGARKIEVGEIWESRLVKLVVLNVTDTVVDVMYSDGQRRNFSRHTFCDVYTKTGKMIDLDVLNFFWNSGKED